MNCFIADNLQLNYQCLVKSKFILFELHNQIIALARTILEGNRKTLGVDTTIKETGTVTIIFTNSDLIICIKFLFNFLSYQYEFTHRVTRLAIHHIRI